MPQTNLGRVAFKFQGDYSALTTYAKYDVVFDGESSFVSQINNNLGKTLIDGLNWKYLAKGNNLGLQDLQQDVTDLETNLNTKAELLDVHQYATSIVNLKPLDFSFLGFYDTNGNWVENTSTYTTNYIRVYEGQIFKLNTFSTYGSMYSVSAFGPTKSIDISKSILATTIISEYEVPSDVDFLRLTTRVLSTVNILLTNNIIDISDRVLGVNSKESNTIESQINQDEFSVNGYYHSLGVWVSTGRFSTVKYKIHKGQSIYYRDIYNYGDNYMIAVLDENYKVIPSKSVLANVSSPNGTVIVDDDSMRYVVLSIRTDTPTSYKPRFGFSTTFSNLCNIVKNNIPISRILRISDFTEVGKILNGIVVSDSTFVNTDFIPVRQGQGILISKITSLNSTPLSAYDNGKNYLVDGITNENKTGSYFYIVPANVHYVKFSAKDNDNILIEINDFQKYYQEKSSNILFKNFERFTSNQTWSVVGGIATSPLQSGSWSFLAAPVGTGEDEFVINCRIKVFETDANGYFELGIGKHDSVALYAITGSYTNTYRWFTLCKNADGSFLKTYNATNGVTPIFTEIVSQRKTVSEELIEGGEYVIKFTKITNPESVLDCKLYNSEGIEIASSISTTFWQTWGTPCAVAINGRGIFSNFSFSYPKNINPKLGWYMDSYGEGASLTLRSDRYVGKIKADVGYKDCIIMGWGGESVKSVIHRMLIQQQLVSPRYSIIALGFNDADFTSWYKYVAYMLDIIQYTGSIPVFVTCCPCGATYGTEAKRTAFFLKVIAINNWIKASGYPYIDANSAVTTDGIAWKDGYLQPDQAHPTVLGHLAIYNRAKLDCPYLFM